MRKADSEQEEWEAYLKRKEEWVAQAEQRKKEQAYRDANRNLEGWSVCNVTCMKYMFENMDYRIYSDLSNWGVENCPDPGWSEDYANSFDGIQPKWGEPNGPCSCKGNSSSVRKADSEEEDWEAYLKRKEEWVAQAEQREKEQAD